MSLANIAPDLTQRPPRSPRVRLGGYVILARTLDKGRAKVAGKLGEYHFGCGLDERLLGFLKITADDLYAQIKAERGDWEVVQWIQANAGYKPTAWEIAQWSAFQESKTFEAISSKERVVREVKRINAERTDILTTFDLLDLDDHVTFGGKP